MKVVRLNLKKVLIVFAIFCFIFYSTTDGRGGGAGGHSSGGGGSHSSSSSSHSSSSHSSNDFSSGGGINMGGGGAVITLIIFAVVIYVVYNAIKNQKNSNAIASQVVLKSLPFPEGLDVAKVQTSFMAIQQAWQDKDLTKVRKWISDGVYQRFTAQFLIMNKLSQINMLSAINISNIIVVKTGIDGNYQTADVAISFSMDDKFISKPYPIFNEEYKGDKDTEYWSFIKRQDAGNDKNLYNNDNCPNCGAPFDTKMGEISRCIGCGTLTNSSNYDWVLSEITQADDYNPSSEILQKEILQELTKNDALFSVQRIEDVASNVFMQIMEVFNGGNQKKLTRFANKETIEQIMAQKAELGNSIFDRLYLNDVTLSSFNTSNEILNLQFDLTATYQRVSIANKLQFVDDDFVTQNTTIILSKNIAALKTPAKETVYSYECPSCGAPYTNTTNEACTYCSEPVCDPSNSWVLTTFTGLDEDSVG